jgi:hypothetical protein
VKVDPRTLVAEVDAAWAEGPPARGVELVVQRDGVVFFRARALSLTCEGCGATVPQSRTRISKDAREAWLLHHASCTKLE